MLYLLASCIALLLGPLFYRFFSTGTGLQKGLDGFIFVSLGGLVLVHILPELLEHGGFLAIIFVIIGIWGPTLSERLFHRYSEVTHNLTLILGIGGLLLHTITDGGAMILAQQDGNSPLLALGIILHRLPVGVAIWWLLKPQVGGRWAMAVLVAMMLLTSVGYFAGEQLISHLTLENTVYLQAFVTGSILHVVLHQPHGTPVADKQGKYEYQAGIGSLLGIALLFLLLMMDSGGHNHHHSHSHSTEHLLDWMLTIAPVLLLSYAVASLRFYYGLTPHNNQLSKLWLQRLLGPEAIIITGLLLGPMFALIQAVSVAIIGWQLTRCNVEPTDPHDQLPDSPWRFGFAHLVDRSAPWILLSLVLANLIGHPAVPLSSSLVQVIVLLLVFLPMRFCNLGAAVLSLSLAYSGWTTTAVILPLIAAPIFNFAQLKMMNWSQRTSLFALLIALLGAIELLHPKWQAMVHLPATLNSFCLVIVAILFASSLLRLGPRKFLSRLMLLKPKAHHHQHSHNDEHSHETKHTPEHSHEAKQSHKHQHGHDHKHHH
ncbi:metal transporter [Shewanella schlegeliana]|uniref:Metal transporter n=1 Tax=Shewanella schlegeliana TaxID=190308 RepID=A0ABS1T6J3_9GAMM|nr:metal transporter [Shewanella schlegeliana]MBL4915437.1 metal transporter [Shewanella schlegeliana]MCL1110039.1 metal transporter [Shewanella schlegeliana]GIU25108.1 metal transporter [Shewanella schlegeliana]